MNQSGFEFLREAAHHAELRGHELTLNLEGAMVFKETERKHCSKIVTWEQIRDAFVNPVLAAMDAIDEELRPK